MEAKAADALPRGAGWQFEPKWDGFRCLAIRNGDAVELRAKSGKPLQRYFPEVVAGLLALPQRCFAIDGELLVAENGAFSFDALQQRVHPAASRINRLAAETPAALVLFDMLQDAAGTLLVDALLDERRAALEAFHAEAQAGALLHLSPFTHALRTAQGWLDRAGGDVDGVIAKRRDEPYRPGERAMRKVKRLRIADCVVGGFRYLQGERQVGSLLLGLFDAEGRLHHVGFTSTIAATERAALTRRLDALVGPPGFTGNAPGGPSRWSTERSTDYQPLRHELVVEVRYDHVTSRRFRHGTTFLRWRPDKAPAQCTMEQIEGGGPPVAARRIARRRA